MVPVTGSLVRPNSSQYAVSIVHRRLMHDGKAAHSASIRGGTGIELPSWPVCLGDKILNWSHKLYYQLPYTQAANDPIIIYGTTCE